MKKVKKERKELPTGPVAYNRSIMAAFEKQKNGKICPLCNEKFSLARYRSHMDVCQVAENDEEIEVIATYNREEAILLRAGPEIVLGDGDSLETSQLSKKRRRSETQEKENTESPNLEEPSTSTGSRQEEEAEKEPERVIKQSPAWEERPRRRSTRIQRKIVNHQGSQENLVKKEKATISEVLEAIEKFELRSSDSLPYYMKYTIRILKKVISTRKFDGTFYADDFWNLEDVLTFYRFVDQISDGAKCLLCRLFIRKPGWYILEKLEQKYPEISNISDAVVELTKWQFIMDESSLNSLDDTLLICDSTVLKNVARKFKIEAKNRPETIQSLRKFAQSQQSILGGQRNVESSILRALKQELGTCVRIQAGVTDLFRALFTIYCPVTTNSANSIDNPAASNVWQDLLYMMLSIDNGTVKFPAPNPCPNIASFYKERQLLFDYITAKSLEYTILTLMSAGNFESAIDLAADAKELIENMPRTQKHYYSNLEVHERKFVSIWVLARCCGHGASILEKQKKYGMAVEWQKWLLTGDEVKHYCLDSRGTWWDRMLLNLDSHLKEKKECAKMINLAIQDPTVLEKELLSIQDRALKLKNFTDFRPVLSIGCPEKRTISAKTIAKNLGDGRVNRFVIRNEEKEEDVECSVEEVVRIRYLEEQGFSIGVHDEGATWHTLFGLLFYDIIFPDNFPADITTENSTIASTWLSEVQDAPTDLSNTLYSRRAEKFEDRFEWLKEADDEQVTANIRAIWELKKEETNRECAWKMFPGGVEDCVTLYQCIPRAGLIAILRRLAQNYRNCRSGFPDLTLWNPETKKVVVVEVKGPGDRLSTKQRLWLSFFADNGVRAEVCHVTAENSKLLL